MAEKQVTKMVIKVGLDCEKCAKKIKKVLCKIPQIQNQIFDKKANTVTVTVVCCSPEKIKQKLLCKRGATIKGIEILPKSILKPAPQPAPPPKAPEPVPGCPPVPVPACPPVPKPAPQPAPPPKAPEPVQGCPPVPACPPRTCCRECYEGGYGGPCFHGYGTPAAPPCYDPPYGRPVYDSWGGGGCSCQRSGYYVCRCEYVYDDGRSSCIVM